LRFQHRENALIVECDALRAELIDAQSQIESAWQSVGDARAEATQGAADEISIAEMRTERDAALQEIASLRTQVIEQQEALRVLQNSSNSLDDAMRQDHWSSKSRSSSSSNQDEGDTQQST
jgi:outer membrane protein TolC